MCVRKPTFLKFDRLHVCQYSAENFLVVDDVNHVVQFQTKYTADDIWAVIGRLTLKQ